MNIKRKIASKPKNKPDNSFMLGKFQTLFFFVVLLVVTTAVSADTIDKYRADFAQAEKYIYANRDEQYLALARQLKDYPLYPYLQYQWLQRNLSRSQEIKQFLAEYKETRYAGLLRNKWLHQLAKNKQWKELIKHYQSSNNVSLQCDYDWALYQTGQKTTALKAAKRLWVIGESQPSNCDALFDRLLKSKYFTREMLKRRFNAALENGRVSLATYVKRLMNRKDQVVAELAIQAHRDPNLVTRKGWHKNVKQAGAIFAHAVDRVARNNSIEAAKIWDKYKDQYQIPDSIAYLVERQIALGFAFRRDDRAYQRLESLKKSDPVVREWQVRSALTEQNWQHVDAALKKMSPEEKQQVNWQYWQARVYDQIGEDHKAWYLFNKVAHDRSFYGFVAAHKLNREIDINDKPVPVTTAQVEALAHSKPFEMVSELRAIDRKREAKRQWWYAVSKLDTNGILLAAKLAQQWDWDQTAIFTIAKAQYWDDVDLRFPVKYTDQVKLNAKRQALDPAIVFGLIRQESAFDQNARSPVGARGLMQIMPKTGRQIARDLNEKWKTEKVLLNPDVNVKYGAYYYKQLLDQFNGHYALAAAAYNAGPHRVKRWLPDDKAMAADIWIETIPFKETRGYVSAVLTYALIYQQRMQRNALKIKDFLRDILPG